MSSPPPFAPPAAPPREGVADRFFGWTSRLGFVRFDGWFGGVAAGAAARWAVDPLIVRGILVVLAILGFPVALVYGVAWAVLPDASGRIPGLEARYRRFHSGQVGALLFIAASFVPAPLPQLFGIPTLALLGGAYFGDIVGVALGLTVAAIIVASVVVLAVGRRGPRSVVPTVGDPAPVATDEAKGAPTEAPLEPDAPSDTASDDDLARWREQHAAWKVQDQAWRRDQQDAARAARDQLRRERQESAAAFAAEAAARRRERHATAPRAPFAFVALAMGAAVIVGTIAALSTTGADPVAAGLFVAALVLAGAMTVAGALRRRSGFLAFVTGLALVAGVGASALTIGRDLHVGHWNISNVAGPFHQGADTFVQPWGDLMISLQNTGVDGAMHIDKRSGGTGVSVNDDVRVDVEIITDSASIYVSTPSEGFVTLDELDGVARAPLGDGRTRYTLSVGDTSSPRTTQALVIEQEFGYIDFTLESDLTPEGSS
ncbi:PspC domain-containing protein [Microbacterium sp. MM2322]|uniref:PspC domain-containing protein n=1 Tax=Microbacterium sp. MM2322 TaxID=3157631 RepID=UPI0032D59BE8